MKKIKDSATSENTKMFDSIASNYDVVNRVISLGLDKKWRKRAMKDIVVSPETKILDLCCGTGDWTIYLAKKIKGYGTVTGIDLSGEMLSICRKKSNKEKLTNIKLIKGDAVKQPFENSYFDYVMLGFGLRNIKNKDAALEEIFRVLKPSGSLICLETSIPPQKIIRYLFVVYFSIVMPLVGGSISKNFSAYRWLSNSTFEFYRPEELIVKLTDKKFSSISYESYTGGLVSVYRAQK